MHPLLARFNPVVGGGSNASVIHYSRNDQKINDKDLVLMDIGCELHGYISDLLVPGNLMAIFLQYKYVNLEAWESESSFYAILFEIGPMNNSGQHYAFIRKSFMVSYIKQIKPALNFANLELAFEKYTTFRYMTLLL